MRRAGTVDIQLLQKIAKIMAYLKSGSAKPGLQGTAHAYI
jgi:hypothetical protein